MTIADLTLFAALTHTGSICLSLSLKHDGFTWRFVITQTLFDVPRNRDGFVWLGNKNDIPTCIS